ncbi:MAG: hypothetical protein Q3965_02620 [Rothia sp. (in: high G+C Gram-positive bacteria)]|nr:hypothetical protein [Rothia sp. (in: high G+C Gram-positive bacteria)]
MGKENRGNDPTQKLPDYGDGNWVNPQIAAENKQYLVQQEAAQVGYHSARAGTAAPSPPPAIYPPLASQEHHQPTPAVLPAEATYAPQRPRKPVLGVTRRLMCILLLPVIVLTGLAGATAYWAETTLINTEKFTELTAPLATDTEFQQALSSSVTEDVMASETVTSYLGNGESTAWYGGVQNWLYDQTESIVNSATSSAVTSENFPALWQQVVSDTHAYNFSGETRPAVLDLSAVYDEAGQAVNNSIGFSLDAGSLPGRTVALDSANGTYPINSAINALMGFAHSWAIWTGVSAGLTLLVFLLWPRNRFAFLAVAAFIAAAALWLVGLIGGGLSLTSGISLPSSATAVLFLQNVAEIMTDSYADFHYRLAFYALIAAVVLTLLAVLSAVLGLTARATTAHTR